MIIEIIFALALILAFMHGYRYGLVKTIARVIGYALLAVIALLFAHPLGLIIAKFLNDSQLAFRPSAPTIVINQGMQFLGSGIAFALIYGIGGFFVHAILRSLHFINKIPLVGRANAILGGCVNTLLVYAIGFFCLQLLSVMNITWIQEQFIQAPFLTVILDKTPVFSNAIYQWWLNGNFKF